ncbi:MAG: hypothetical protein HRU13_10910 [Phycisphaerales bacterium]|nr:hypothetical protein [Phycisphaerales bacterium]
MSDVIQPQPIVRTIQAPEPATQPETVSDILARRNQQTADDVTRDRLRLDGRQPVTGVRAV